MRRNVSKTLVTVKGSGLRIIDWDERLAFATRPKSPNSYQSKWHLSLGPKRGKKKQNKNTHNTAPIILVKNKKLHELCFKVFLFLVVWEPENRYKDITQMIP